MFRRVREAAGRHPGTRHTNINAHTCASARDTHKTFSQILVRTTIETYAAVRTRPPNFKLGSADPPPPLPHSSCVRCWQAGTPVAGGKQQLRPLHKLIVGGLAGMTSVAITYVSPIDCPLSLFSCLSVLSIYFRRVYIVCWLCPSRVAFSCLSRLGFNVRHYYNESLRISTILLWAYSFLLRTFSMCTRIIRHFGHLAILSTCHFPIPGTALAPLLWLPQVSSGHCPRSPYSAGRCHTYPVQGDHRLLGQHRARRRGMYNNTHPAACSSPLPILPCLPFCHPSACYHVYTFIRQNPPIAALGETDRLLRPSLPPSRESPDEPPGFTRNPPTPHTPHTPLSTSSSLTHTHTHICPLPLTHLCHTCVPLTQSQRNVGIHWLYPARERNENLLNPG